MTKTRLTTRLRIAGTPVEVTHEEVPLSALRLDPENPRIRLQMTVAGRSKPSTPEELLKLMQNQRGYEQLHKQIRSEGGLSDPLIVRHDGRIVEGNTRFAVSSILAKTQGGGKKWGTVPIMRLPPGTPEKVIQLQMAGYHVSGKTPWRAAAKADQIYRLITETKASIEEVAVVTRMTPKKVQQNIDAYNYLIQEVVPELKGANPVDVQEILESKFSHALELMTRRNLEQVRNDKDARRIAGKAIAEGKIKGLQVRQLHTVLEHPRAREALERHGFEAAKEVLRKADPTNESQVLKSVEKLTTVMETLGQGDLDIFRAHEKARQTLEALVTAASNVLEMAKRKDKKRA